MKRFGLTHMQEAMFFEIEAASTARYVSVIRYKIPENTNATALKERSELLAKRHESLRTHFVRDEDGNIWHEVSDRANIDFIIDDDFNAESVRINPFSDRLFRLILCGNDLIVVFHHALFDGWSIGVFMRELFAPDAPESGASPFRYYIKWLGRRNKSLDLDWWKRYLNGEEIPCALPCAVKSDRYGYDDVRFDLPDSDLLRQRAKELRITPGQLVQAVWCLLMARYNGGTSVVCVVDSGRGAPVPGIADIMGMCVNTLPVLTKLPKPPESVSFSDWVSEWSRQDADVRRHGFCGLGDLIKGSLPHILTISPPFEGEDYKVKSRSAELVTDFDATFTLDDTISAEFEYNPHVYSDKSVSAIKGHFLTALSAVLKDPHIKLELIPILTEAERSELSAFNDDNELLSLIDCNTVVDLWLKSAKEHSDRTAIVFGDTRLTYAELADTAQRLSSALKAEGVKAETPVALKLQRSERYVIAEIAVISAGGFFIPLDTDWPDGRIETILNETKPFMVIDDEAYARLLAGNSSAPRGDKPSPRNAAYMIMTSGTTGIPKGVVIEHRSLANVCLWAQRHYYWQAGDSVAMALGFGFDGSMWDIWLPLISGGALHILKDETRFSISALQKYCKDERVTHIDLPVAMANSFREVCRGENALSDLRVMVSGGEEIRRVIPAPYPLSNEYGPTECTVCCSAGWLDKDDAPISVGAPSPNMHAYILDDWGRICPVGVTGEAFFSGVQVARGYYNSPELTAARFIDNPFSNGNPNHDRLYRTGDLMKLDWNNGRLELFFKSRADNQIKLNGYRIELGEIENALLSHHMVSEANVAFRETPAGEKKICAYIVTRGEFSADEADSILSARLPAFMRPVIIPVESIPLTVNGKVDYSRLPLLGGDRVIKFVAPASENEKALISAVSRALNVTEAGMSHNYLELGGNSINAMRAAFYLERDGFEITAGEIISSGNLAELAAKLRRAAPKEADDCPENVFTPLDVQRAMVFLAEAEGPAMYTVTLRQSAGGLNYDELKRRLDKAVKLHDILRTTFEYDGRGNVLGRVHDTCEIPVYESNTPPPGGIHPLRGPLLDVTLGGGELMLRYNHIALDGWGVKLLLDELLYDKFPQTAPSFARFANRAARRDRQRAYDEAWWRKNCENVKTASLFAHKSSVKPKFKRVLCCPPDLLARCSDEALKAHVTLSAFLLAAWGIVLRAQTAADGDFLIPFVASFRDDDGLMGMCASAHPLRFGGVGESFRDLARNVQDAVFESIRHMYAPQDIISGLPKHLFAFENGADAASTSSEHNYDLVLRFADKGEFIYNSEQIEESFIRKLAARLESALERALDDRVSAFLAGERELVAKTFARGRILDIRHKTAAEAFAGAATEHPERTALETDDEALTYAALYGRAKALADNLAERGVGAGDVVAYSLPRNSDGIVAPLGIALSGAAFLPLDPAWPLARVNDIIRDSSAAAVIKDGMFIEMTGVKSKIPSDCAYLIYTSGTTGKPKGVMILHRALANQISWTLDEFGLGCGDRVLHYVTFTFDPSVWTIFTALSSGAALCLLPERLRLDLHGIAQYIEEQNISMCTFPAAIGHEALRRVEKSRLRIAFLGGDTLRGLPQNCGYEIVNLYGPTEACVNASFRRLPPSETSTRNIGKPVANMKCYVLDARGEPSPVGIAGELCLGGVQLACGYLNRPDETAAAFTEHPEFGKIYHTGDYAFWNEDGTLEFLGRRDGQIKIRGNRVEIGEIERVLCEIPGVADAKIRLAKDALNAYIIPCADKPFDERFIRQRLAEQLPSYMLPRTYTALDAFPLAKNGKIDLSALPVPNISAGIESETALSETEAIIAGIWRTALGLDADFIIGKNDDFFELGGHSLLLFGVSGLLAAEKITINIKTLMEHPTLKCLADAVDSLRYTSSPKPAAMPKYHTDRYERYVRETEKADLTELRRLDNVLITGGTGFLGSYLIHDIYNNTDADVYLPVRGDAKRIEETLSYYFGAKGEEIAKSKRLRAYTCDISEGVPSCGVSLDAIFHAAADIRHYAPEDEMYRANVTATENMLELAKLHKRALFAHISTTSAVNSPIITETDTDLGPPFDNIYQRTKQLAERLVLDAGNNGVKFAIFRVGHVSPALEAGLLARNWEINATLRWLNAMLLTGLLPEQNYKIGFGFADKVALSIRLLSQPLSLENRIFHIDNPKSLKLSELFALSGDRVKILPLGELTEKLRGLTASDNETVGKAAAEYLGKLAQRDLESQGSDIVAGKLQMDATLLALKRLGFEWPQVTAKYLEILKNVDIWPSHSPVYGG